MLLALTLLSATLADYADQTEEKELERLGEIHSRDAKIAGLEKTMTNLLREIGQKDLAYRNKLKHVSILEDDALEAEKEIRKLNSKVRSCKHESERFEQEIKEYEGQQNQLVKDMTQMYSVYRDQEKKIHKCKDAKKGAMKEVEDLKLRLKELETEFERKIQEREQEIVSRVGEKANCGDVFIVQKEIIQGLADVLSRLNEDLNLEESQAQPSEEQRLSRCESQTMDLRNAYEKCSKQWETLSKQWEGLKKELVRSDSLQEREERMRREFLERSDQAKNCVKDLKLALDRVEAVEEKWGTCKFKLDSMKKKLEKTEDKLNAVKEDYDEIRDDCLECDEQLTACEKTGSLLDFEKRGYKAQMDLDYEELKKLKAKTKRVEKELKELKGIRSSYEECTGQLELLQTEKQEEAESGRPKPPQKQELKADGPPTKQELRVPEQPVKQELRVDELPVKQVLKTKPEQRSTDATSKGEEPGLESTECNERLKACVGDLKPALERGDVMEEQFGNCKSMLDSTRKKLEETEEKLTGLSKEYDEMKEDCENCDGQLAACAKEMSMSNFEKSRMNTLMEFEEKNKKEAQKKVYEVSAELQDALRSKSNILSSCLLVDHNLVPHCMW